MTAKKSIQEVISLIERFKETADTRIVNEKHAARLMSWLSAGCKDAPDAARNVLREVDSLVERLDKQREDFDERLADASARAESELKQEYESARVAEIAKLQMEHAELVMHLQEKHEDKLITAIERISATYEESLRSLTASVNTAMNEWSDGRGTRLNDEERYLDERQDRLEALQRQLDERDWQLKKQHMVLETSNSMIEDLKGELGNR